MEEELICKLCSAASHLTFNVKGYVQHIRFFHAHHTDFNITCGIGGCQRSYTNCGTFLNHVYAVHGESSKATCQVLSQNSGSEDHDQSINHDEYNDEEEEGEYENYGVELPSQNYDNQIHCSQEFLQKSAATFLLGLKEKFKLTQVSLQGIIQGVTSLNSQNISTLKTQVAI